jgi:hypothetical protein
MSDNRGRLMRSCVLVLIIVFLVGFTGANESARAQVAGEGEDPAAREAAAPLIPAMAEAPQPQPAELPDAPTPEFNVTGSPGEDSGFRPPDFDFHSWQYARFFWLWSDAKFIPAGAARSVPIRPHACQGVSRSLEATADQFRRVPHLPERGKHLYRLLV